MDDRRGWEFDDPRRADRPTTGPGRYRIERGRIATEACEINVVEHCNLQCRGCSHLSPALRAKVVDPAVVLRDLSVLAPIYAPEHVRLLGGEPLLHPRLAAVAAAVRESGMGSRIRVVTNGTLLGRADEQLLEAIDELHVSVYPGAEPDRREMERIERLAARRTVDLVVKEFHHFRQPYAAHGTDDRALVERLYRTCQIAHTWRCHTIDNGFFYRCPQSLYLREEVACHGSEPDRDRLAISARESLGTELLAFLERPEALGACGTCLGSVGVLYEHVQVARREWRSFQASSVERVVDWPYLEQLERDPNEWNSCWAVEVAVAEGVRQTHG